MFQYINQPSRRARSNWRDSVERANPTNGSIDFTPCRGLSCVIVLPLRFAIYSRFCSIFQQVTQIDGDLRHKATTYSALKNAIASLERKTTLVFH